MGNNVIIIEQAFNATAHKVWNAITDKDEMKIWYFDLAAFKPEVGFRFQFMGGPTPERQYQHLCQITEVIPGKKLTYSWLYEGFVGKSFVTWELFEKGNITTLRLTHKGIDTFPPDNQDFAIHNFEEGWDYIIHTSLKDYLEKQG